MYNIQKHVIQNGSDLHIMNITMKSAYLILKVITLISSGNFVCGLKDVHAVVPQAVSLGENATLICQFDLEGAALYSVKWYIGRREFYRYTPRESPSMKVFPILGLMELDVQRSASNATQLTLKNVTLSLSGRYSCEVSADAPSFHTALVSGDMDVVVIPKNRPELHGMKSRYRVGDTMTVTCVSRHSTPAPNLTWSLNGKPLGKSSVKKVKIVKDNVTNLLSTNSTIQLELTRNHFNENGRLKVRCTASLYSLYWQIIEKGTEREKQKSAVVAASNTADVQPYWRDTYKISDKVSAVSSRSHSGISNTGTYQANTDQTMLVFLIAPYIVYFLLRIYLKINE